MITNENLSKIGTALLASLATSTIINKIQDSKLGLKNLDPNLPLRFRLRRAMVNNCYAEEAIHWFEGNIDDDCLIPFDCCCEIIQIAFTESPLIQLSKIEISFEPKKLAVKICDMPNNMEEFFTELGDHFQSVL